ncbi:hypothetical protein M406DRAFT_321901 [Cryphonectria parasitica EP155]|uniref:Uncharacterized protein n=1 Tax=Cryphonectria parasitica (strain ATCC 38755 / EP155) TaxID=660469 RepID=A0A9P4Y2M3_CRYP1|nr:uncharacterized protein M406DRAFT_321901 [Cryphonectria parasitica EP155]KAF3765344.1 hypothetical protein M406DRAFT_321901 [Cryphonectria parasitica EP155]
MPDGDVEVATNGETPHPIAAAQYPPTRVTYPATCTDIRIALHGNLLIDPPTCLGLDQTLIVVHSPQYRPNSLRAG